MALSSQPHNPPRSKNGCISCRIRRVKCDETRPHCNRCTTSQRVCDGYLPEGVNMTRRQLADVVRALKVVGPVSEAFVKPSTKSMVLSQNLTPTLISPVASGPSSSHDYVFFDYFRRSTAPSSDTFIPSSFWNKDLLQLAHTEPAVWHAALALGVLHRRWEIGSAGEERTRLIRKATIHYGKAMSLAKDLKSPSQVLALTLPLVAAANLLGFWSESHIHMINGFALLARENGRVRAPHAILSTLTRMELLPLTFGDFKSPYPFEKALSVRALYQGIITSDEPFESYPHAATMLFALVRKLLLNGNALEFGVIDGATKEAVHRGAIKSVEAFERKMAEFEARKSAPLQAPVAISLRIYHAWLRVRLTDIVFPQQSHTDEYLAAYQRIAALAHAFVANQPRKGFFELSLEPAVVLPLFDVAKSCRHPALRRHIRDLLRVMNRHEGIWRSDMAATGIDALIDIEEPSVKEEYELVAEMTPNFCAMKDVQKEALELPWSRWSQKTWSLPSYYTWDGITRIPETHRVYGLRVESRFEQRELDIRVVMSTGDPGAKATEPAANYIDMTLKF